MQPSFQSSAAVKSKQLIKSQVDECIFENFLKWQDISKYNWLNTMKMIDMSSEDVNESVLKLISRIHYG